MKKIILVGKILFGLSWIFLLLWAFQDFRIGVRLYAMHLLGFGEHPGTGKINELVALTSFKPEEVLVVQKTLFEKPLFPTIEIHGHLFRSVPDDLAPALKQLHITYFVNLALPVSTEAEFAKLAREYPQKEILHFPGLNMARLKEADYGQKMAADLEEIASKHSIKGIKVWKNFGLLEKTPNGQRLRMDDPLLAPLWEVVRKHALVVGMHTGDPPAFWQEADERNERLPELLQFPERSMDRDLVLPFADLMAERERLFQRERGIIFIAQHFGELGHDLRQAGALLDRNPNVYFDLAQRIDELGRQPRAARAFFIKYQDRILFGMDGPPDPGKARIYWRFLESNDEYFDYNAAHKPRKSMWKISGLNLPREVLQKIYAENARRILRL